MRGHFSIDVLQTKNAVSAGSSSFYTCSMDPQVRESKPGRCPICHMELTEVTSSQAGNWNEIQLSEQQVYLGNIQTDTIRNGLLRDRQILTGTVNFNQLQTAAVSARVEGRIVKLYVKSMGDFVEKGMPLYEIYSEDLNNAKQEYLNALQRKKISGTESMIDEDRLIRASKTNCSCTECRSSRSKKWPMFKKRESIPSSTALLPAI